jgi:hypothetical protein
MAKGKACSGVIRDQNGQELANIQTVKFGLGNFYLTPSAGSRYEAEINIQNGPTVKIPLPTIKDQGFVMQVSDSSADDIYVNVYSKGGTGNESLSLFVNTRQSAKLLLSKSLQNHRAEFQIKRSALGEGVSHLTLFTENLTPLCERLYFIPPAAMNISLTSAKQSFDSRQKVQVDVATTSSEQEIHGCGSFCFRFLADSLQTRKPEAFLSYFWLSSDLTGGIESPDYYFLQQARNRNGQSKPDAPMAGVGLNGRKFSSPRLRK